MTREIEIPHKIAILSTGDEVVAGDIVNSNSQEIASRLTNAGMNIRLHMAAPDTIHEIEEALAFLLKSHTAIIITGGLGPTSDDLTRFALSKILDKPLVFNQAVWDEIYVRLRRFGYTTPPESNRQQAMFPADVTIIANPNGTAAGCMAKFAEHLIFMLPGPPNECLPMVDKVVVPTLLEAGFAQAYFHKRWFLFGVGEGKIAEELDKLAAPFDCVTGYRLFYPYIEFKIHASSLNDVEKLIPLLEERIKPYLIGEGQQIASQLLRERLLDASIALEIYDGATGGTLQSTLENPKTRPQLRFIHAENNFSGRTPQIEIKGLKEYWDENENASIKNTTLEMRFNDKNGEQSFSVDIPYRGAGRLMRYTVESVCARIYEFLQMQQADSNFHQN
jgi:nicotinamide-nucleotide amidase